MGEGKKRKEEEEEDLLLCVLPGPTSSLSFLPPCVCVASLCSHRLLGLSTRLSIPLFLSPSPSSSHLEDEINDEGEGEGGGGGASEASDDRLDEEREEGRRREDDVRRPGTRIRRRRKGEGCHSGGVQTFRHVSSRREE